MQVVLSGVSYTAEVRRRMIFGSQTKVLCYAINFELMNLVELSRQYISKTVLHQLSDLKKNILC